MKHSYYGNSIILYNGYFNIFICSNIIIFCILIV